jgi:trimeric autotransporter adhesin
MPDMKPLPFCLLFVFCWLHNTLPAQVSAVVVKDIAAGTFDGDPRFLVLFNGAMYFSASDGANGRELWKSDGTEAGTVLVKDIRPGNQSSSPTALTVMNGVLYFGADDGTNGWELWKSDGTTAGTVLLKDIVPGVTGSFADGFCAVNNILFFSATNNFDGVELWKSDGTDAGTVMVKDIFNGSGSSDPGDLTNVGGALFFSANNGSRELWKSDGTTAGTVLVKDINPCFPCSSSPSYFAEFNGFLYFTANDGPNGPALWKSDGTNAGTVMVFDVPGLVGGPKFTRNINGTLYFAQDNGSTGDELWKSDGTTAGTVLVRDIRPGSSGSTPQGFTLFGTEIYFQAATNPQGIELWKTNGASAGTSLVLDIEPGFSSSTPSWITVYNSNLYFVAFTGASGRELMRLSTGVLPVTWMNFTATLLQNKQVLLQWKVSDEVNNSHFEIEQSSGAAYATVGRVAAGNASGSYTFTHQTFSTKNFYRIKQVDRDGKFSYSKTVQIDLNALSPSLQLFPNPVRAKATVQCAIAGDGDVQFQLTDSRGVTVRQWRQRVRQGHHTFRVDLSAHPAGRYQLTMIENEKRQTVSFIRQ